MLEYLSQSLPILIPLIMYFVRLEIALAKLQTDLVWIKNAIPGGSPRDQQKTREGD